MSFLGVDDLLEVLSVSVDGHDDESGSNHDVADDDVALSLSQATTLSSAPTLHTVSSTGRHQTYLPPSMVQVSRNEREMEDDCITIVSSAPSSASSFELLPNSLASSARNDDEDSIVLLAVSPYATRALDYRQHPLSLSTTSTRYTTGGGWHDATLLSSLSTTSPPSLTSSVTMPSSFVNSAQRHDVATLQNVASSLMVCDVLQQDRKTCWYETLESEDDWDAYRHEMLEVLCAVGEVPLDSDPDAILAQLIMQEEQFLWKIDSPQRAWRHRDDCTRSSSPTDAGVRDAAWLSVLAASITMPLVGISALLLARR